jgi:aldehyde dehydrogenase (NAD+)
MTHPSKKRNMSKHLFKTLTLTLLGPENRLSALHIGETGHEGVGAQVTSYSPIDGLKLAQFQCVEEEQINRAVEAASEAFHQWKTVPAPRRGELVRRIGETVRTRKEALAELITLETGKITQEALGEVQEWIDLCDFAVGLSRQLYGLTIASERPGHRMMEQWHPLGPVGIITAFNFPVAVWAWNAMLALVCGNSLVWKPSEKTPLCAAACHEILVTAAASMEEAPNGLSTVIMGDRGAGQTIAAHQSLPLISATGSVPMGREVAQVVGRRLGRSLLELGGNNAMIVTPSANLEQALRAIVFSAVGTAGQRCTTLRRLIVHREIEAKLTDGLIRSYRDLPAGDPRKPGVLIGPLIDEASFLAMEKSLETAENQGGEILVGGKRLNNSEMSSIPGGGYYVSPALVKIPATAPILKEETFAPILYVVTYNTLEEAISLNNNVPQGLSSAIFTGAMEEAERFLSATGSDCGIANVNIGTSGAEIGGAFGGEKETGGGRESGSDAWKNYMRRTTNTVNYSGELPLSQGIEFNFT